MGITTPSKALFSSGFALLYASVLLIVPGCAQPKSGTGFTSSGSLPPPGACASGPTAVSIRIFQENPRTSSGDPSLPFSSPLSSAMTYPAQLSGLSGNCLLQSSQYSIASDSLYPGTLARPLTQAMEFSPSQPEFQQLNSFYFASTLSSLVTGTLGASWGRSVSLDAHCNQEDNAYYSPSSSRICLGWHNAGAGTKVWASDDADVVVHEAGHAVNHNLASTSIMNSTEESGAIDESLADYWAFTVLNDAQLAEWFLGAIGSAYVRDATRSLRYPDDQVFEIHDDSRVLTEVLWDLRAPGKLGRGSMDLLVRRALQLLPATARFADFYEALYEASGPLFLNLPPGDRAAIVAAFSARGLHRADDAAAFRLSTSKPQVYVIDDHSYSFQSGGNCNGVLDAGETALILVNLENPGGSHHGVGSARLGAAPAGIHIPSGGGVADYFRFKAGSDFVSSLPLGGSNRDDAIMMASFVVSANSTGVKNFSMSYKPMYSDPTGTMVAGADVSFQFALTVGSAATASACNGAALWP